MLPSVRATELTLRGTRLAWGARTHLMGVVNLTPDSFSGDGLIEAEAAVERALGHLAAGADIVDLGAESTRPGHRPVEAPEELRRLVPVVRDLRSRAPAAILSIDTCKAEVFRAAHAAGGDVLNSVCGLTDDLLAIALECDVPVVIMHNGRDSRYERGAVDEVLADLASSAARAVGAGLRAERVILDPGIGFGKTPDQNIALLGALPKLVALGFPTMIGTSRKSTIGKLTGRSVEDRAFGTAATVALAAAAGVDIVRVHDVAAMRDVVAVGDAIARGWRPPDWEDTR
jgi:dihydropteroate synthase